MILPDLRAISLCLCRLHPTQLVPDTAQSKALVLCTRRRPTAMSHIFISHVDEDKDVVALLAQELEAAGYQTWHYTRDSLPGSSYLVQIERAIVQAHAVVVVISQHTLQAPLQITPEIVRAYEGGKPLIPVLRDLTHEALQQQPEWRQAMAATVSLPIPSAGVAAMLPRLLRGLQDLGLQPQRTGLMGQPPSATGQPPGPLATMLRALRQWLARYWRRLVSWLTVIFVLLNILKALELEGVQMPGVTGRPWPIVLGLGLLILMRFPRLARLLTRLILGPPQAPTTLPTLFRGPRPYGQEDVLPDARRIATTAGNSSAARPSSFWRASPAVASRHCSMRPCYRSPSRSFVWCSAAWRMIPWASCAPRCARNRIVPRQHR